MYYRQMDIQLPIGDKVYVLRYGDYIAIPEGKFVEVIDDKGEVIFEWRTTIPVVHSCNQYPSDILLSCSSTKAMKQKRLMHRQRAFQWDAL